MPLISQDDVDVTCPFLDRTGRTASTRLKAPEGRPVRDVRLLDMKTVGGEIMIILGVSHRTLQSLPDQEGRLLRREIEGINRVGNRESPDLASYVPCFLG